MPRQARLDAPGVLHHVMVRGDRAGIVFRDNADREDFVRRLSRRPSRGRFRSMPGRFFRITSTFLSVQGGPTVSRHEVASHGVRGAIQPPSPPAPVTCSRTVTNQSFARGTILPRTRPVSSSQSASGGGAEKDLGQLDRYPYSGHSALMGRIPRPGRIRPRSWGGLAAGWVVRGKDIGGSFRKGFARGAGQILWGAGLSGAWADGRPYRRFAGDGRRIRPMSVFWGRPGLWRGFSKEAEEIAVRPKSIWRRWGGGSPVIWA